MEKDLTGIIATGLQQLDDLLEGGLLPGEIFLIGGRKGSGKTTLAVKMALQMASVHKTRVLLYSLDMNRCYISRKMGDISDRQEDEYLNLPWPELKTGMDNKPARWVAKDILIIDKPGTSLYKLKRISEEMEVGLLVIDYLQLINDGETKRSFPYDIVMRKIKHQSGALKIPAIVIVQTLRTHSSMPSQLLKCEKYSDVIGYIQDVETSENQDRNISIMKNRRGNCKTIPVPKLNRTGTRYIDFGTLGLKIGDEICFKPTGEIFHVASGNGTPDNGGTLIRKLGESSVCSMRLMTRRLRGEALPFELDVYELWTYRGKTFRMIYEDICENPVKPLKQVKTYDNLFLKIDHFAKYPAMLPYIGGYYISALHKKLLLIGESNYFPETSTIHKDAIKWYDGNQSLLSVEEIKWINNRKLTACARHQNYKNINDCFARCGISGCEKPISHISYMNAFQRPAVDTGKSFKYCCTEKDLLVSVATINKVIEIIKPDTIIFVSKYSWDALHKKIAIKDNMHMDFVSHTTDPIHWENKKYTNGKIKFFKLLTEKYLQGP